MEANQSYHLESLMLSNAIKLIYLFDYGGPVAFMYLNEDRELVIKKNMDNSSLVKGMAVVARLLKKFSENKFFAWSNYVGVFGKNFIIVSYVSDPKYSAFAMGYLRKLVSKIDSLGVTIVDNVLKIILTELEKSLIINKIIVV